jgi:opacity protein-like surface antigen
MTTGHVRSPGLLRSLLAAPSLVVALLSLAGMATPAAHADAVDNVFVTAVKAKGIDFPSAQAAIVAGHEVCDELDLGKQKSDVVNEVMTNSNLDGYRAGFFVGASVAAYCPRYRASG